MGASFYEAADSILVEELVPMGRSYRSFHSPGASAPKR